MRVANLTLTDVTVFDGTAILGKRDVVVEDGLIAEIREPRGLGQQDRRDAWVLPGFIDAHVHIGFFDPRIVLSNGITSVRDLGWPRDEISAIADRCTESVDAGPLVEFVGPIVTAEGGYPSRAGWAPEGTAREIGERDARDVVTTNYLSRYPAPEGRTLFVKVAQAPQVGPTLSRETLTELVAEAHSVSMKVTSHCTSVTELEIALDCGIDELAHGLWSDEGIDDDLIERMASSITVVPTLHIDPSPNRIKNLSRFIEAGGRVIYGTDMGNTGPPPGIDVEELKLMESAGMSRLDVLKSATSLAGDYLGLGGRGTLEVGRPADLLVVDGNPFEHLEVLSSCSLVLRSGVRATR